MARSKPAPAATNTEIQTIKVCVANSSFGILPWQRNLWKQLINSHHNNRLSHAYLISGIDGVGKLHFTCNLVQSLLCQTPAKDGTPCNSCRSCHLFRVGNHPDIKYVIPDPEKKTGIISIDTIREVNATDELTTRFNGYKIIVITPADHLNRSAANSLLKTLEEPNPSTLLLLVTSKPARLLPTIKSRCQYLFFKPPKEAEALAWLATQVKNQSNAALALRLTQGAPLAALNFLQQDLLKIRQEAITAFFGLMKGHGNYLTVAETWNNQNLSLLLTWVSSWLADLLRLQTAANNVRLDNPDLVDILKQHVNELNSAHLHRLWSQVITARKQLQQSTVNPLLLIETILIQWSNIAL